MPYTKDSMTALKKEAQKKSYILDEAFYLTLAMLKLMDIVFGYYNQSKTAKVLEYDYANSKFEVVKNEALRSAKNLFNIGENRFEQYISSLETVRISTFDTQREWADYLIQLNKLGLGADA